MGLLTIGAFARAARLTPKALRLYAESGLLTPAAVDPESGYRFYHPAQLEHARLIARLRGIGMPLARIRDVCALDPPAAAAAVSAFWQRVSADTADRARLTSALVEHLSGRETTMTDTAFRCAARSDAGTVRDGNEDLAYASPHLLAVADGTREPAGGAAAAAAAIDALKAVEHTDATGTDMLTVLATAVTAANRGIAATATGDRRPVTTLTAVLRRGTRLALVHVGDTRVYLLRNGELSRLTQDHTWVRHEVEQGRLSAADAAAHPQRALLVRALGAAEQVEADLALRTALPGDRYLLCSDGLHTVVGADALRATLAEQAHPRAAADRLIALAHEAGAPDNIAVAVGDVPQ